MTDHDQEYDDATSTLEKQQEFEAGCLERLDILTKTLENYRRFDEESRKVVIMVTG